MLFRCHSRFRLLVLLVTGVICAGSALLANDLAVGVRGVATRAPGPVTIDGNLTEFADAFCTPVEYFHKDSRNRAAQFFYMWDNEAFYAGLRTLDEKQANHAPDNRLSEGDGVEWYFDTRRGDNFRNRKWESGAVHCYWTGYTDNAIAGRFCLRPGYLDAIERIGIEVAGRRTSFGAETEFKLPWANFPNFSPRADDVIALDAELCYSDGGPRVFRTFAYGSPLSVQQPASLAKVQLVERLEPEHWRQCGPVMMPMRIDTPWKQKTKAHTYGSIALPPNHAEKIGRIEFAFFSLDGKPTSSVQAEREDIETEGHFVRAVANWPADDTPPGAYLTTAIVYDKAGNELTRVAPRLVSVNMQPGY